jgi:hypothetical protein
METSLKLLGDLHTQLLSELKVMEKILEPQKGFPAFKNFFYKHDDIIEVTDTKQVAKTSSEVLENLTDGFYSLVKKSAKEYFLVKEDFEGHFPDTEDLFKNPLSWNETSFNFIAGKKVDIFTHSVCTLILETKILFNFELIKKLKDITPAYIVHYDSYFMFSAQETEFKYLLMPLRN